MRRPHTRAPGEPSPNDLRIAFDGSVRQGLEPDLTELHEHRDSLDERINQKLLEGCPMLKGTGFVVIDPAAPRFDEEFMEKADAEAVASHIAHTSRVGTAIIYVPISVVRPERPTVTSQPSALLRQLALETKGLGTGDGADANKS